MKYFVGVAEYHLDLPGSTSLKDKRRFVKSVVDRIGNSKMMSACEVGRGDYYKSASVAVTSISSSMAIVSESLEKARRLIECTGIEVVGDERWIIKPDDLVEGV